MDELTIDGKTYVSSKRAAAITGYAKDYVGQLCREGRVEARLVGRSWYVYEPSIREHRFAEQGEEVREDKPEQPAVSSNDHFEEKDGNMSISSEITNTKAVFNDLEAKSEEKADSSEISNIQAVWQTPTYKVEENIELPLAEEKTVFAPAKEAKEDTVEEIEDAWQSWFKEGATIHSKAPTQVTQEEAIDTDADEELNEVPVHVIRPQEERNVEYVDMPRMQQKAVPEPVYTVSATENKRTQSARIGKQKSYLAVRAVLISVMIIATAIAFLGSGLIKAVPQNIVRDISFIQYFEGISSVEKTIE